MPIFIFALARPTVRTKRPILASRVKGAQPCHAWRHSCATDLLAAGLDAVTVAHRLGHSSARVTLEVYGHVKDDRAEAAASLIRDRLASLAASAGKQTEAGDAVNAVAMRSKRSENRKHRENANKRRATNLIFQTHYQRLVATLRKTRKSAHSGH